MFSQIQHFQIYLHCPGVCGDIYLHFHVSKAGGKNRFTNRFSSLLAVGTPGCLMDAVHGHAYAVEGFGSLREKSGEKRAPQIVPSYPGTLHVVLVSLPGIFLSFLDFPVQLE